MEIVDGEAVELVSVDRDMALALIVPYVLLVYRNTNQVRHEFCQAMVMVSFHPDDFNVMFGVRELADVRKKLPMLFGEPPEIEVREDVSQENEALELRGLQKLERIPGAAYLRAEMQIRDDDGINTIPRHALFL